MKLFQKLKEMPKQKNRYFAFFIEEIYSHLYNKDMILAYCEGDYTISDIFYLVGPYGFHQKIKIDEIITLEDGRYLLIVDEALGQLLEPSCMITNQDLKSSDARNEVNNYYLSYLLYQMSKKNYEYLDILFEELTTRAYLISDYTLKDCHTLNNHQYLSLYTSNNEHHLEKTHIATFADYASLIQYNNDIEGLIINPSNKERNMLLSKEVIEHALEAKDKNIIKYANAKRIYSLKKKEERFHG